MTKETAHRQGLEVVFPEGHELHRRIFWDKNEGSYYDVGSDLYLDKDFDPVTWAQMCQKGTK